MNDIYGTLCIYLLLPVFSSRKDDFMEKRLVLQKHHDLRVSEAQNLVDRYAEVFSRSAGIRYAGYSWEAKMALHPSERI
jgi:hypothetical protein